MRTKEWLIEMREKYNITQQELANAIGLTKYTISNIEQNQRKGSDDTWNKIEEYFDYKDKVSKGLIETDSMCRVNINEDLTKRGLNDLFFQIEIDDEKGHRIRTISYQRNCVANMLHKAPIFNFFKSANGKLVNKLQCEDYCNKLEQVVSLLEKISKIY